MNQLSNVCGASTVNNQILFFDGHGSHFDNGKLRQIMCKNIQPFALKPGDSINNQPNDNVPNANRKYVYNVAKVAWILKYGANFFSTNHMNSVLVEAWDAFNISAGNIIRDRFTKTKLSPFSPTDLTKIPRYVLHPSKYLLESRLNK